MASPKSLLLRERDPVKTSWCFARWSLTTRTMTRQEKTSWEEDTRAVLLAALVVVERAVFHPFKEIRIVYRVLGTTPSLTKTQKTTTRSPVTAKSPTRGALWSSVVPVLPGSTSLVRKWKELQYLTCGTVHYVKQKVQRVELNLGPEKQGAESWPAREQPLETSSDRTIKRSPSDPWQGGKLQLIIHFQVARRGLWYKPPRAGNLWNRTQVFPLLHCVKNSSSHSQRLLSMLRN